MHENDILYLYTSVANFMSETDKRVTKIEKQLRRNRAKVGCLSLLCIGMALDIFHIMREIREMKSEKSEEKSGD